MLMTGSEILVRTLEEQGVDTVFGYPGGNVINIYDALYQAKDRIHHIITSHEQGAAHAADGYARASGKVGVVIATSGPGATNLVTGIATAFLDSTPMVAITGNVPLSLLGKDSFQEVDIAGVTLPVTKHNFIVKDVTELYDILRNAFCIAQSGRPGPVLVDIPKNVQLASCAFSPKGRLPIEYSGLPEKKELQKAVQMIQKAKKPFIYCGGGVILSNTSAYVLKLAEKIDAPVGTSMMGLSAIPHRHPSFVGMTGMHGRYASSKAMNEADLIIVVGARFSDRATGNKDKFAPHAKILHIDTDRAEINKNITANQALIGDLRSILPQLLDEIENTNNTHWLQEIADYKAYEASQIVRDEKLNPKKVLEAIRSCTSDETVVATDVGQHQMWTTQFYDFEKPRTLVTSGGLGTMGFGLGAAIGACIAKDKAPIVLITGDGSFHMNLNELATAVKQNLPIKVFILNNRVLGMVRQWQTLFFEKRYSETSIDKQTDYVKLAEAFGATGLRIQTTAELEKTVKTAFDTDGPVVVDCAIDADELVLPMIPPGGTISDIIM